MSDNNVMDDEYKPLLTKDIEIRAIIKKLRSYQKA